MAGIARDSEPGNRPGELPPWRPRYICEHVQLNLAIVANPRHRHHLHVRLIDEAIAHGNDDDSVPKAPSKALKMSCTWERKIPPPMSRGNSPRLMSHSDAKALSPLSIQKFSSKAIVELISWHGPLLSPKQIQAFPVGGINKIPVKLIDPHLLTALTAQQLAAFSDAQISSLWGEALNTLVIMWGKLHVEVSAKRMRSLTPKALSELSAEALHGLSPSTLAFLSTEQCMALSGHQIQALMPTQLAALPLDFYQIMTVKQAVALSAQQLAGLSTGQQMALMAQGRLLMLSGDQLEVLPRDLLERVQALQRPLELHDSYLLQRRIEKTSKEIDKLRDRTLGPEHTERLNELRKHLLDEALLLGLPLKQSKLLTESLALAKNLVSDERLALLHRLVELYRSARALSKSCKTAS